MSKKIGIIGWREWVALPDLGIQRIKCKIDTGARTSTLHAFFVERFIEQGRPRVHFAIHPLQRRTDVEHRYTADLADERMVCDSGGHREKRCIIRTRVLVGSLNWPIEITLTSRDTMRFRMLLGRTAIHRRFLVDPSASYLADTLRIARVSS